jgi:hypothetical protein
MAHMSGQGPAADRVLAAMAEGSQDSLTSYKEQLSTTHMLYTPQAVETVIELDEFPAGFGFCHVSKRNPPPGGSGPISFRLGGRHSTCVTL